jgi:hypothetical protein
VKKASKKKADILAREIGCVVTRVFFGEYTPGDIHHPAPGRKRISDDVFFALSPWFHRGIPPDGLNQKQAAEIMGPSLALNKKAFIEAFGTELELYEISEELYRAYNETTRL